MLPYEEETLWQAVAACDEAYDGAFFYGARTVGVYCRASCKSRTPLRKNIVFFETAAQAEAAHFRPCKRCRPDLLAYEPVRALAEQAKALIDGGFHARTRLTEDMRRLGVSPNRLAAVFKQTYGIPPLTYLHQRRLAYAKDLLAQSPLPILEVAYATGFESLSAFYAFFKKQTGLTPKEYQGDAREAAPMHAIHPLETPVGRLGIVEADGAIAYLLFPDDARMADCAVRETALTREAAAQLCAYFAGERRRFALPLRLAGTPFQNAVWRALQGIPYGETRSYQAIAAQAGAPKAARAVGMANHRNPLPILVPCHRVVGADGRLTGYAGGLDIKQALLALERRHA